MADERRGMRTPRPPTSRKAGPQLVSSIPGTPGTPGIPGPPTFDRPTVTERDIHLLDRLAVVSRYRGIAISVFAVTMLIMITRGYTKVQLYQAQARLLVESERAAVIPGLTSAPDTYYEEDTEPYYQTQFKIIKGRDLARRVVRRLHLEANPEFNGAETPPSAPVQLGRDLAHTVAGLF